MRLFRDIFIKFLKPFRAQFHDTNTNHKKSSPNPPKEIIYGLFPYILEIIIFNFLRIVQNRFISTIPIMIHTSKLLQPQAEDGLGQLLILGSVAMVEFELKSIDKIKLNKK